MGESRGDGGFRARSPAARRTAAPSKTLGKFELGSDEYSIGLALQQIGPYLRTSDPLPASFAVPIIREERKPKLVASYGSSKIAELAGNKNVKRNRS